MYKLFIAVTFTAAACMNAQAQQTVVNKKGTLVAVDTSKWRLNSNNIYNKNTGNVGIGTSTPNTNAKLDVTATDKGILMPRVALTATNSASPLSAHVEGMVVYNTATAGTSPNNVIPGYYYNTGTRWQRLSTYSDVDLRLIGGNHITSDGGVGGQGTSGGTGGSNIFIGSGSGFSNTTGSANVALGAGNLKSNLTGFENTALGNHALESFTGSYATAVGSGALRYATGGGNLAVGRSAGGNITSGINNLAIGMYSLSAGTVLSRNTAVGYSALSAVTADNNIGIGNNAGSTLTTGANNILIGNAVQPNIGITDSNQLNIGNWIYGNTGRIGLGTATNPNANAQLEIAATNKGLLMPRLALTSTASASPLSAHVAGMMVYNTATAGTAPNNVLPGFYYNNGTKWERMATGSNISAVDTTNDSWKDEAANTQVRLAYLSNGTTARPDSAAFVIKDNGRVGIGTSSPSTELHIHNPNAGGIMYLSGNGATGIGVERLDGSGVWARLNAGNNTSAFIFENGSTFAVEQAATGAGPFSSSYSGNLSYMDFGTSAGQKNIVINNMSDDIDLRIESDSNENAFFFRGSDGKIGVATNAPTAMFDVNAASASTSGLRLRNISDSKGKQDGQIDYSVETSPLFADKNGYVYKKSNPVLTSSTAKTFDGEVSFDNSTASAGTILTGLGNGSIVRFQLYISQLELGVDGIGANLYADITFGYGSGFSVSSFGSETGGTGARNTVTLSGVGTLTLTFDFSSGRDLVIYYDGAADAGSLKMYHTGTSETLYADIFQSFKSR